jgi:hypothetical protein
MSIAKDNSQVFKPHRPMGKTRAMVHIWLGVVLLVVNQIFFIPWIQVLSATEDCSKNISKGD